MSGAPSTGAVGRGGGGVADFLAEAQAGGAGKVALMTPDEAWSHARLSQAVDARAAALEREGVAAGAVVPAALEADFPGIVTLLALWRLGAVPAALNPRLSPQERDQATAALAGWSFPEAGPVPQAILWTSGTSGRPRGVALSADNLRASARAVADRLTLGPGDVWLASLSLAHVGGLALVVRSLLLGGTLAAWGRWTAASTAALLEGVGLPAGAPGPVTHLSLVPTQLLRLMEARGGGGAPAALRCALIGGAHAPDELVGRALAAGWPLALTYGMTEMTSQVATAPPELARRKPGTVGRPLEGAEVDVDVDGQILVRGATLAMGVLDAAAGTGALGPVAGADGWYATGDLGRFDGDGHLWITGRRSDRIVTGGATVDPREVETALRAHPAVADVCVVGLPDAEWGEIVAAAVVPVEGEFDPDEVAAWIHDRVSAAKRPRRWMRLDALPLNANGKVDRGAVRRRFT